MDLGEIRISATQDSRESSEEGSSNIIDLDSTGGPVSHGAAGLRLASSKRVCLDCKRARCRYLMMKSTVLRGRSNCGERAWLGQATGALQPRGPLRTLSKGQMLSADAVISH
jgi:hypothetical protein